MKKLLQINSVLNCGSTGRIAEGIGQIAIDNGWDSYIAYGRQANQSASNSIRIGNKFDIYNHVLQTRLFDKNGFASKHATKKLIAEIKTINPDVIHLQNLHGYYINLPILFEFLQRRNKPVVWTLVDCWAFTGHCSYFDVVGCNRWITGCYSCPQKKSYPASYVIDNSSRNYELKKSLFNLPQKMTIVVHCNWLKNNVRQSYLNDIPVELIHNGIDVSKFYPRDSENLKKKLGIQGKFIILGVANQWTQRLGFNDFIELSKQLRDDEVIVLDGVSKKQGKLLPSNILVHPRARNIDQLAELYSCADVFLNPVHETNFPTTNIEALACGTPIVVYDTGGCPDAVSSETGLVVPEGGIDGLVAAIQEIKSKGKSQYSQNCISRVEQNFNHTKQFKEYINLFESVYSSDNAK